MRTRAWKILPVAQDWVWLRWEDSQGSWNGPILPQGFVCCFQLLITGHAVFEQTCIGLFQMNFAEAECQEDFIAPSLSSLHALSAQSSQQCLQVSLPHRWLQLADAPSFPQMECGAGAWTNLQKYHPSGTELLKYSQRQYYSPWGRQKQEISSRLELDAHSPWVIEFSIRKITLQVLSSWFLYAVGMGGSRSRRAVDSHRVRGFLWDTNQGMFRKVEVAW